MKTFADARANLERQIWRQGAAGLSFAVESIDIHATEDGMGAIIFLEMSDGETLYDGFDFSVRIDPDEFDGQPYVAEFLSISDTRH